MVFREMAMGKVIKASTFLFYAVLVGLASCGGGSDGSGDDRNDTISATVGSSYTVAVAPSLPDLVHVNDCIINRHALTYKLSGKAGTGRHPRLMVADFECQASIHQYLTSTTVIASVVSSS